MVALYIHKEHHLKGRQNKMTAKELLKVIKCKTEVTNINEYEFKNEDLPNGLYRAYFKLYSDEGDVEGCIYDVGNGERCKFSYIHNLEFDANINLPFATNRKTSAAQRRATDKWQKENYEFIKVRLNKGEKEKIKAAADCEGKSINQYITSKLLGGIKMLKALEKLYNEIGFENPNIIDDVKNEYLTENTARNGRPVLWYVDNVKEVAIYLDNLQLLTDEEIENELM